VIGKALTQAREARLHILKFMNSLLPKERPELSPYAPKIAVLTVNPDKIGAIIGPGGKMINGLIKKTGVESIDIEEDGSVFVAGNDVKKVEEAVREIKMLNREFKVGEIVEGNVVKILDFGAILDLGGGAGRYDSCFRTQRWFCKECY